MNIRFKGINWRLYQGTLIPDSPPHIEIYLTREEQKELLKKTKAYFIRWTNEWDKREGCFWYVIKDEKEDWSKYSSNTRNQIRKGLKYCKIEKVSKEFLAENGYNVYINAFKRYKTFLNPLSRQEFRNAIMYYQDYDFWGAFYDGRLVAYSQNLIQENVCNYSVLKIHPEYLKLYPSYALLYEMNRYYLNERNFLYVNDGARSLSHQTNIQSFLISKFKFRKAYCKLNIVYREDIEILVNILFHFRKMIYKIDNNIFQKLSVLLRHEEIRRGIC